jgi:hypothetical protein
MSQQIINTGVAVNDGKGDSLRSAGIKINSNFTELYATKVPSAFGNANKVLGTNGTDLFWVPSTVSDAIQTTSVYENPSWIGSLSYNKITGKPTVPTLVSQLTNDSGFITSNGLPSQAGNNGKYLTTNGSGTLSWATVSSAYSLPTASTSVLGGVKVDGSTITINGSGVISGANTYTLPTATTSILGGVKIDGTSITINGSGVISASVTGAVIFKGTWNASTNTPTLANGTGTAGWQYAVSVSGTRNLGNGSATYNVGDFVIYDGASWINISGNSGVTSFNTRAGAITLTSSDVTTALTYTPLQSTSLSVATTTASAGGSLSYSAGVFTFAPASIPTYTINTAVTPSGGGSLSLNGTTFTFTPAVQYTLPTATPSGLGGVKVDNNTIVINNGIISVGGALTSATIFKGSWDASTNTPTLVNGTGTAGYEYIVSVAATRNLGNGSKTWSVGDLVIYDGSSWAQIPGGNNVASFNTRQGAITLTSSDVTTALGFTPIQASSLSITSNTATGTTSTLSYTSGVFTFTSASSSSILNSLAVSSSNGFSGSVSSATLTIQTSITGLLKGNGTSISAATAGTDYQAAINVTGLLKSNGTGGNVSAATSGTDYAPGTSALTTGIVKSTSTTGALTIAVAADINSTFGSQTQNYVYAAPGSGGAGNPTFRALVNADLPTTITATAATATSTSTAASLGYLGMPQQSKSSAYTTVIGDQGKHIYVTATANITIDSNANVPYPIGTTIAFIAAAGATVTIAITSDTMYLGGTGTTGSRTLAAYGMATAVKVTATTWFINGAGLT